MTPHLIFLLGSLSGSTLTLFCVAIWHSERRRLWIHQAAEIKRKAYAEGYQDAAMQRLPTKGGEKV